MEAWIKPPILPNSVALPVALTYIKPLPLVTDVPEYTFASWVVFETGIDSPVRRDSSIEMFKLDMSSPSAGTRSPSAR
jgi:hypothetical protein